MLMVGEGEGEGEEEGVLVACAAYVNNGWSKSMCQSPTSKNVRVPESLWTRPTELVERVVRRTAGGNASTPIGGVKSSSSIAIRITFPRGGNNIAAGAENDVGDGHGTWAFLLLLLTNTLQNSPNTNYSLEFSTVCTTYSTYAYGSATRTGLFNTLRQLDTY